LVMSKISTGEIYAPATDSVVSAAYSICGLLTGLR
jgi:hypothetical protein